MIRKERCPKCAEEGRDTSGDNLAVYPDGKMYCHAGHGVIRTDEKEERKVSKLSVEDCLDNPDGHDPARMIPESIWRAYGIRCARSEISGEIKRIYYPYYNDYGTAVGVKCRSYPKDFFVAGKLPGLWGKQVTHKHPVGALFITEGEEDTLALKAILSVNPMYSKHDVVSIPNGANSDGKLDATVMAEQEFFSKYTRIYICFDIDAPGVATAKRLASWLSGFIPDVRIVTLPGKDASHCLVLGKGKEVLKVIAETKQFRPSGIIHGSEIKTSDILRAVPAGYDTPFRGINDKLRGLRKGEIVTICAASGIGKSTLVNEIAYDQVVRHGLTVCHIALENVVEATAAGYVAMDNNVPVAVFRTNPASIEEEAIEVSMDRTVRKMYFFNHFGSLDSEEFKEKLMYYARSSVDFIFLDHLSMVISGSDIVNERKEIDKLMTFLASMVVSTGVGLVNVVHLKRRESNSAGKSFNEGGQVSLTDLRGSAALEQLSWTVLGLERNPQAEDGSEDYAYPRVLKNRTWGRCGKAGRLKYMHTTGRLVDAPEVTEDEAPVPIEEEFEEIKIPSSEVHEDKLLKDILGS